MEEEQQWIFMNGEFVRKHEAKVSVYDHGFLYGDGVFEGIRTYDNNIYKLKEHLIRLFESARSIMMEIPYSLDEMTEIVVDTVRKNDLENAYIRVVVSRGVGNLGLDLDHVEHLKLLLQKNHYFRKNFIRRGLKLSSVATRRNRPDVLSPKVKSLNYLNNILVKIEANLAGVPEALMLNDEGYVAEGSGDNIFIVKNGVLYTPPGYVGALEGITRQAIIDIADDLMYTVKEQPFTRHDVYTADEVFLTGTAAEVIAVVKVDGRVISDGKPGQETIRLTEAFREKILQDGTPVYEKEMKA
ncbi:LOW QUALITY PROTEIN: branched-chain amino acid aminotransferase [Geomicrobium sp. JCM 19038]|nr:LOW QUALITY PROTEIN: branched-chain amino acid aminotransferase [Geomicrobium sp. JCM 19038]